MITDKVCELELYVNNVQRGAHIGLTENDAIAKAKKMIKGKSKIIGSNGKPLPYSEIRLIIGGVVKQIFQ